MLYEASHNPYIATLVTKSQENRMFKSQPMAYLSQIHLISQSSNIIREHKEPFGVQHNNTWPEEILYTFELYIDAGS